MDALLPLLAVWHPGMWEMIILLLIILVLFGSRLPKIARSLGQGITEFKKGIGEGSRKDSDEEAKPPTSPTAPPAP